MDSVIYERKRENIRTHWPLRKHVWCHWRIYSSQMVSKTCVEKEHALSLINTNYPLSYELKRKHYVVSETGGEEQFQVSPYFLSIQVYCLAVVSKSKTNFRIILNRDFDFRIILKPKIFQDILISWISFRIIKTSGNGAGFGEASRWRWRFGPAR